MSSGWLQNEQVVARLREAIASYWPTNEDTADLPVVWDSFKAVVRGECISAIKAERVVHNAEIHRLQEVEQDCAERDMPSVLLMLLMYL